MLVSLSLTIKGENVGIDLGLVKEDLILRALTAHKNWATLDQAQPMISGPIQQLSGPGPRPPRAISRGQLLLLFTLKKEIPALIHLIRLAREWTEGLRHLCSAQTRLQGAGTSRQRPLWGSTVLNVSN